VIDGREVEGRYISEYAYTLYAIGADAEAHKDLAMALQAFEAAAQEDAESPQIWTRIGAIRCRTAQAQGADEAFETARDLDPDFEPLAREQATCALAQGQKNKALELAKRAFELDPDSEEPVLLYARILAIVGRSTEALRLLQELSLRRPSSMTALRELRSLALGMKDQAAAEQASKRLAALRRGGRGTEVQADITLGAGAGPSEGGPFAALEAVDAALRDGDLKSARKLARRTELVPADIAVRAAALGKARLAREQAELVLGAEPTEVSARIALAVAADLAQDTALLERTLAALPPASAGALSPPSLLARMLFAELLFRRVGDQAARLWLGLADGPVQNQDPFKERTQVNSFTEPLLFTVLWRVLLTLSPEPPDPPGRPSKQNPPAKTGK
jgi:tetratricopeptide (TPR) repeat protein